MFRCAMYGQPHDVDAKADTGPLESCLLDRKLFVGSGINGTTARYELTDPDGNWGDIVIQVTLVVAPPPRVSYILTWVVGTLFTDQPVVVATLGDHVLLEIAFRRGRSSASEYFVYQPSAHLLYPIPQPSGKRLVDESCRVGLLPHGGNGHYHITALVMRDAGEFDLFLYSSMAQTWTIKRPVLMVPDDGFDHLTYKVIPVGGSMVAFVDIWNGILFCDVLDGECPELHHVPLPSTGLCRESTPRVSSKATPRDVTIEQVSGYGNSSCLCIRFVEVVCRPIFESWHAALWSTTTAATTPWRQLDDWRKYSEASDQDLLVADGVSTDGLLPETSEWDDEEDYSSLGSLFLDMPLLSLHQDNVVFIMAKRYMKKTGVWVMAVDMPNKKLQGLYRLGVRRVTEVLYSSISIHANMTAAPVVKGDLKRLGAQLESYPHKKHHQQMVSSPFGEQEQGMAPQDADDMDLDSWTTSE